MPAPRSTRVKQRDLLTNTLISLEGAGNCCPVHQLVASSGSSTEMVPSDLVQVGICAVCCLRRSCALWRWADAGGAMQAATSATASAAIGAYRIIM